MKIALYAHIGGELELETALREAGHEVVVSTTGDDVSRHPDLLYGDAERLLRPEPEVVVYAFCACCSDSFYLLGNIVADNVANKKKQVKVVLYRYSEERYNSFLRGAVNSLEELLSVLAELETA